MAAIVLSKSLVKGSLDISCENPLPETIIVQKKTNYSWDLFISGNHADDKFVLCKKVRTICSGLRLCALVLQGEDQVPLRPVIEYVKT